MPGPEVCDCAGGEVGHLADLSADREKRRIRFLDVSLCGLALRVGKKHFPTPFEALSETNAEAVSMVYS